ncbi:MAG: Sensory response regulator with diguanylate cyclase domain [Nitrospira sp.]|nr:Sensory response regulator with diguanylate cyclase domain [Nitrospira sp.]
MDNRERPAVVLVADDDKAVRQFVRTAIEQIGLEVCEASSGAEVLEQFALRHPDVIVLDVTMPVMGGFAACSKLRAETRGDQVPILMMTGFEDTDAIARAYEHGATDFIAKPLNPTILSQRIRYLLRGSQTLRALLRSEARLGLAQRIAKIGNWEWQPESGRFSASYELCRLMGIRPQDFGGTLDAFLQAVDSEDRERVHHALTHILSERTPCDIDHRIVLPNGSEFTVNLQAEAVFDEQLKALIIVGTAQDISERKRSEREIHRLAYFDSLTGLPNRVLFKDRVTQAIAHARRYQYNLALLFLDLDRFKATNDTLGHHIGDLLLKHVADRLMDSVRHSDSIGRTTETDRNHELARLGGDEFTVLLTNLRDVQDAGKVAKRILEALARPFFINGHEIFVTVSIGIAIFPTDGDSVDILLRSSDTAMYHAKEQGRNNFQYYSHAMNAAANERLVLEAEVRQATTREEFVLYYQPQVDLRSGRIVGAEVLIRWLHPQRGLLGPNEFLQAASDTGSIRAIDEWVLRTACRQARAWQQRGFAVPSVSINVSNSLFHGSTLFTAVQEALNETGLAADRLELELTEPVAMRNLEASLTILHQLKHVGVQLAIDDFGTGYSSLNCLQQLPFNRVKIDHSLIRELLIKAQPVRIVRAIIAMAHSLQLDVLGEGVEQEEQRAILIAEGCDQAQGYLFGHPMPAKEFELLLPPHSFPKAS